MAIRLEELVLWADQEANRLRDQISAWRLLGEEPHPDLIRRADLARAAQMELSKIIDTRGRR